MKKILTIICIILLSIIILTFINNNLLYILKIYVKDTPDTYTQKSNTKDINYKEYSNFFTTFEKVSITPGLKEGGIPQGLCYSTKYNVLLISEYHKGGAPSVIHILDIKTTKLIKSIILNDTNGNLFTGHVGGIATNEETLWITDYYTLYEFSLQEIINSNNMSKVNALNKIDLSIKADFINYHNDILWIGEYYYFPIYQLDETKNKDRLNDKALLIGYNKDFEAEYAFYLPDKAQGIAWTNDNKLIISSSFWSFESSNLTIYNNPFEIESTSENIVKINDKTLTAINIEDSILNNNYVLPPMAEGITIKDDELYVTFESASNLYRYYTKYRTNYIFKTNIENNE